MNNKTIIKLFTVIEGFSHRVVCKIQYANRFAGINNKNAHSRLQIFDLREISEQNI